MAKGKLGAVVAQGPVAVLLLGFGFTLVWVLLLLWLSLQMF